MSRLIQFETFFPKPLPTLDSSRVRSVALKFLRRDFAQLPIGTITSSWYILKSLDLLNCRRRSQESRKRLGHFPGKEFFLCQINSSVQSQPCSRKARMSWRTYVCLSPLETFS